MVEKFKAFQILHVERKRHEELQYASQQETLELLDYLPSQILRESELRFRLHHLESFENCFHFHCHSFQKKVISISTEPRPI